MDSIGKIVEEADSWIRSGIYPGWDEFTDWRNRLEALTKEPVSATCFHQISEGTHDDEGYLLPAGRYALYPASMKLFAAPPAPAVHIGFRCRVGSGLWNYIYHRSPDSFELRECEIQNIYAHSDVEAAAPEPEREGI